MPPACLLDIWKWSLQISQNSLQFLPLSPVRYVPNPKEILANLLEHPPVCRLQICETLKLCISGSIWIQLQSAPSPAVGLRHRREAGAKGQRWCQLSQGRGHPGYRT